MRVERAYFAAVLVLLVACGGSVRSGGVAGGGSSMASAASSHGGVSVGGGSNSQGGASRAGNVGTAGASGSVGCEGVECLDVSSCAVGYELAQPPGACCAGCFAEPGQVGCLDIPCPPGNHCPLGYMPGDRLGGCCTDCVPDPKFCNQREDCALADRPRSCCDCPEAISMRAYQADACWSLLASPRAWPMSCYPDFNCGAVCVACPEPGLVACVEHRCVHELLE
jgi:hypothetical protein